MWSLSSQCFGTRHDGEAIVALRGMTQRNNATLNLAPAHAGKIPTLGWIRLWVYWISITGPTGKLSPALGFVTGGVIVCSCVIPTKVEFLFKYLHSILISMHVTFDHLLLLFDHCVLRWSWIRIIKTTKGTLDLPIQNT